VSDPVREQVDHLVYATPDLEASVEELAGRLGVRAAPGGRHPAWGTRNALLALGERTYLEILGPDLGKPRHSAPRLWKVDELPAPRLLTWAARAEQLPDLARRARQACIELGEVQGGRRRRPDGTLLSWTLTDPSRLGADGILPFFIDWGDTPHPAGTAPRGLELRALRAEHPEASRVREELRVFGLELQVEAAPAPALVARLSTPLGERELR
jgi:hypothetical protein